MNREEQGRSDRTARAEHVAREHEDRRGADASCEYRDHACRTVEIESAHEVQPRHRGAGQRVETIRKCGCDLSVEQLSRDLQEARAIVENRHALDRLEAPHAEREQHEQRSSQRGSRLAAVSAAGGDTSPGEGSGSGSSSDAARIVSARSISLDSILLPDSRSAQLAGAPSAPTEPIVARAKGSM